MVVMRQHWRPPTRSDLPVPVSPDNGARFEVVTFSVVTGEPVTLVAGSRVAVRRCCAAALRIIAHRCYDAVMRTTVDLPDDLHALARELAHQQHKTLSGVIVEMLRKATGTGSATRDSSHETGWPTVNLDRPITIEDVRSLEDEW